MPDWCYELAWTPQPLTAAVEETVDHDHGHMVPEPGHWLIFDSRDGLGAAVAERLRMKAHEVYARAHRDFARMRRAAVQQFLTAEGLVRHGVVYLSGLDVEDQRQGSCVPTGRPDFAAARSDGWGAALDLVHALTTSAGHSQRVGQAAAFVAGYPRRRGGGRRIAPCSGTVTGLGSGEGHRRGTSRTAVYADRSGRGRPPRRSRPTGERDLVGTERGPGGLSWRRATRGADCGRSTTSSPVLCKSRLPCTGGPRPYRLEITGAPGTPGRGQLDNVALQPANRQAPGPGQVEIKVRATGLNFRDVLNVLDLYPGDPGPLGGECAGEIVAVGPGVERFKPGDAVVGLAPASFASYVTTLAEFVGPKPEHLSFEEAATIPICFLTVQYALRRLGQIQPGERVLIHAASGGVGLAAIQIARQVGAEIFATAGSPRKREYLRSLGIQHVMDSRTLDFADQIRDTVRPAAKESTWCSIRLPGRRSRPASR